MKTMMPESSDFAGTPRLDYEAWRAYFCSEYASDPEVSEPSAFAGWMRPQSVFGFPAVATKIQCGAAAMDAGCNAHRLERTHRDVRLAGVDYYRAIFPVTGRSAVIQNARAVELAVGDVALVDMSRPATFSRDSGQWLTLQLPRQALVSHLGVEPQGGLYARGGTLATRLLCHLIRDAIDDEASLSAPTGDYMRLAVYDLLGALFAPSDPLPRHTDKLFARICSIVKDRFADPNFGPSEAAAEAGITLRHLQRMFTARGSTCRHFIQSVRLEHAARLLRRRASLGTSQFISEIAYACGYIDYNDFSRRFRCRFGYPPSAYPGGRDRGTVTLPNEKVP
jgi:AraC family transcriptional activator of tynA and feaB